MQALDAEISYNTGDLVFLSAYRRNFVTASKVRPYQPR